MSALVDVLVLFIVLWPTLYWFYKVTISFSKWELKRVQVSGKGKTEIFAAVCIILAILSFFIINNVSTPAGVQKTIYSINSVTYALVSINGSITLFIFILLGIVSYINLAVKGEKLAPIPYVISNAFLVINFYFIVMIILQASGFDTTQSMYFEGEIYYFYAYAFLGLGFMFLYRMIMCFRLKKLEYQNEEIDFDNKWLNKIYVLFVKLSSNPGIWIIVAFPLLIILQLILVLFGQKPDEFIKMFFDTSTYRYSMIPAPDPIILYGDSHYLCTVSARGHEKIVKPLRSGIRRNERIVVNRQLLIANAFENILEDYLPKTHKAIRFVYDKYGYPISKHINKKWSADIVYFIMKPLEWLFLIVLYCVDKNPENRINIQYSELRK